ncbi:MAG TPA: WYL domain-containing protein [Marmoricola sp.]|nr:WYL domain-containing protein [Marmoricola sp.]
MAARKSERLLNLLITLLVSRSYVTKDRIRSVVQQYREAGDEAFEKMFERDKEELRSLGIPIEVGTLDRAFEDEPGYRVVRSAFELPDVALEADEAAVVGLAARVWQHAGLAAATSDAVVKLKAAGVSVDREALDLVQPQITAEEPAFEPFWDAVRTRTPLAFGYRSPGSAEVRERHLQPWGVVSVRGRWYAVGHDTDRDAPRMFRLSRVHGEVRTAGAPGGYVVPAGTDLRALTESLAPPPPEHHAVLRVRAGTALGLRRTARRSSPWPGRPGWDRVEIDYGRTDAFVEELLGYGDAVVVAEPDDLHDAVIARLRAVAAGTHDPPGATSSSSRQGSAQESAQESAPGSAPGSAQWGAS